jgi:biotin carboxylase
MKNNNLLFLNPGWEQTKIIGAAIDSGTQVFAICDGISPENPLLFKEIKSISFNHIKAILSQAIEWKISAVLSDQCDYSLFVQSYLCESLNLLGPRIHQSQICSNKFLFREALKEAGIQQPANILCCSLQTAKEATLKIGYPAIVKPIDNRGSTGVSIVNKNFELAESVYLALSNSPAKLFLVEEFIIGEVFLVEGYTKNLEHQTLSIGKKQMDETYAYMNADILFTNTKKYYQEISDKHQEIARTLSIDFGATSAEYIVNKEGIWPIEFANRGGGVCISSIVNPVISGLDTCQQLVADSQGKSEQRRFERTKKYAYLKYINLKPGRIKNLHVCDIQNQGVIFTKIWSKPGDIISSITDAYGRSGVVITCSDDADEAIELAQEFINRIEVTYE